MEGARDEGSAVKCWLRKHKLLLYLL